ncbi:protein LSM14 homolog B [Haplochromis burtoni]|uniref:protein LSM14 homolog B n=1 Tax=Haplochromis burtoni TaxID=8153 RepID=UPI0006C9BDEB|nr:protein LSM14 homolog B [Haplochromis burtoni]
MASKPYIGCKVSLLSKAQNRYEGILYTIDAANSTVVLAEVKCFGTEGRPTDRPTSPKDDVYEYITFRGSDIKDITLGDPPRYHHGLPQDPAIIQTSSSGASSIQSTVGSLSPLRMPAYNQVAASSLLNQQYVAALGLGPLLQGLLAQRGPMVEKAVQTVSVKTFRQRRGASGSQQQEQQEEQGQQQRNRRQPKGTRGTNIQTTRVTEATMQSDPSGSTSQDSQQQNAETRPPARKRQGPRRRRNRRRGQLMVANALSPTLKFDTDFDFDSSNAQFIKEALEEKFQERLTLKDGNSDGRETEGLQLSSGEDCFGPKCYYDKAKSFFDNISSDNGLRLTWAEERKRNLETFGVPGRFLRGQGFRGGYTRRGRGAARV